MFRKLLFNKTEASHIFTSFYVCSLKKMSKNVDIANLRHKYHEENSHFLEASLVSKDPMKQFDNWFKLACQTPDLAEPNAMTLATVKPNGRPAARMVLLKHYDEDGFWFFTNYRSAKSSDLEKTPFAALVLHWEKLCRSIRVEGKVKKLSEQQSNEYFSQRPRASQIAAHVSQFQSSPIESRDILKSRESKLEELYKDKPIPRPEFWGGFIVEPELIEFWQGQHTRMHDRIVFTKAGASSSEFLHQGENNWVYQRLEP